MNMHFRNELLILPMRANQRKLKACQVCAVSFYGSAMGALIFKRRHHKNGTLYRCAGIGWSGGYDVGGMIGVDHSCQCSENRRHLRIVRFKTRIRNKTETDFPRFICHDEHRSNRSSMGATRVSHASLGVRLGNPVFAIAHPELSR